MTDEERQRLSYYNARDIKTLNWDELVEYGNLRILALDETLARLKGVEE